MFVSYIKYTILKLVKKLKVEKVLLPTSSPQKLIHGSQKEQTPDIVKIMIISVT